MSYFFKIIIIILLVGIFGGIINYLLNGMKTEKKYVSIFDVELLKCIFVGMGASLLVPLFLNMISSDIIKQAETNDYMLLVFIGFCLIASISSKSFINSISEKILKELGDKVNKIEEDVKPIIQSSLEPDNDTRKNMKGTYDSLDNLEISILKSLENSKYVYRTINGIVKELQENNERIKSNIEKLINKGLIKYKSIKNKNMYYITVKGKECIAHEGIED
ncbi:hypothetical protein SH1V18_01580 [Vallitalea longa]|uniref:YEATS-Like-Associating Three TM domain-containing protein n=1 Tax=Vallitalea longa TaxID=2936439 RepID=A0A9W6DDU5_9FIRM|nr:YEATS-associated helix-containing protein [Vallitalea longa]GKX27678.1 hypothetical protein SH1V18_01580 [Vallitalea longa]